MRSKKNIRKKKKTRKLQKGGGVKFIPDKISEKIKNFKTALDGEGKIQDFINTPINEREKKLIIHEPLTSLEGTEKIYGYKEGEKLTEIKIKIKIKKKDTTYYDTGKRVTVMMEDKISTFVLRYGLEDDKLYVLVKDSNGKTGYQGFENIPAFLNFLGIANGMKLYGNLNEAHLEITKRDRRRRSWGE